LDILRRHARVEGRHDNLREVDGREEVHRHSDDAHGSQDDDRETENNDEVGITYGEAGHGLLLAALLLPGNCLKRLRFDCFAGTEAAAFTNHYLLAGGDATFDLHYVRHLNSSDHFSRFDLLVFDNHDRRLVTGTIEGLQRNNESGAAVIQPDIRLRIGARDQDAFGIRDIHLGMHGTGGAAHAVGETRDFAARSFIQRRDSNIHGITDVDVNDIGFGNGNDQAKRVVLREPNQWSRLGG